MKMAIFDLDGTLAPPGGPIPDSIAIDPQQRLAARTYVDDIGAAVRSILDRLSPESEG